jgi:hypothetical protein
MTSNSFSYDVLAQCTKLIPVNSTLTGIALLSDTKILFTFDDGGTPVLVEYDIPTKRHKLI